MSSREFAVALLAAGAVSALIALVVQFVASRIQWHLPRSLVVEYASPAGDVIDHGLLVRADRRVAAAAIADLAVRGRIRMLAPPDSARPIAVHPSPGATLTKQERAFLAALQPPSMTPRQKKRHDRALARLGLEPAGNADIVFLTGPAAFPSRRARELRLFLDERRKRLVDDGLAHGTPVRTHLVLLALLFLAAAALGILGGLGALFTGLWPVALAVLPALAGLLWLIAIAPPGLQRFTPAGTAVRRHLSGVRDYVRLAEQDRIRMLESPTTALRAPAGDQSPAARSLGLQKPTPDMVSQSGLDRLILTERLLPYAILFRQERAWKRELRDTDLGSSEGLRTLGATTDALISTLDAMIAVGQVARLLGSLIGAIIRTVGN
ncbi:DUF2207 domain-containing protein [Herbiconiux sp.]|uniref:DUF2207 domain-containing protein n=1 Tax=Herbiconiux sp. TaxID=1871186 RepID=UPI0025B84CF3|nr:DUF2207 domain-containing protein [Herbiconiux sp.]